MLRSFVRSFSNQIRKYPVSHKIKYFTRKAFSDKYLLYTNISISISLSAFGDYLEQNYEIYTKEIDQWNKTRTMHMGFSGMTVGFICHHWYMFLDRRIPGRTFVVVMKKLLLDQTICSPIIIITFFASVALFEDITFDDFKKELQQKFMRLYKAEWVVWPPAQIINFYLLPTKYRVLYDSTISLGYDIFTSHVKHSKVGDEKPIQSKIIELEAIKPTIQKETLSVVS